MGKYRVITKSDIDGAICKTVAVQDCKNKQVQVIEAYMPFKGYKTWFRVVGKGNPNKAPIILLHGGPGGSCDTLELLDILSTYEDRQIISYDQLGCGHSYVEGHLD